MGGGVGDELRSLRKSANEWQSISYRLAGAVRSVSDELSSDGDLPQEELSVEKWQFLGCRLASALRGAMEEEDEELEAARFASTTVASEDWSPSCKPSPAPSSVLPTDASTAAGEDAQSDFSDSEDSCSDVDGLAPRSRCGSVDPQQSFHVGAWQWLLEGKCNSDEASRTEI